MTQEEAKYILEHTVLSWSVSGSDAREAIRMAIKELKRKKGKWIRITDEPFADRFECSECGKFPPIENCEFLLSNYCPNCGADMRGEANEMLSELY